MQKDFVKSMLIIQYILNSAENENKCISIMDYSTWAYSLIRLCNHSLVN